MNTKTVGLTRRRSARAAAWYAAGALLATAVLAPASFAAAPNPTLGSANVDGNPGEWAGGDHFADMTDGGDPGRDTHATLSVRYDCDTETLYALVMTDVPGKARQDRPDEAYVAIDGTKVVRASHGDDGTPPDFAWVNGDGTRADGYEASANVAPGSYTLRAHVLYEFDDGDGYLPLDTVPREAPLTIDCPEPTPEPTPVPTDSVNPTDSVAPTDSTNPTDSVAPTDPIAPTDSVLPTQGVAPTPTPAGNVGGVTRTPKITLPPTDTLPASTTAGIDGWRFALVLMAGIIAAIAFLTPARRQSVKVEIEETEPFERTDP